MSRFLTYSELRRIDTFDERFEYLKLGGGVGLATFGYDRYLNQRFYRSRQWRSVRSEVILRDDGCDLGIEGFEILHGLYIHHMNPITPEQIRDGEDLILDPNQLITVSLATHNAIHYGDATRLPRAPIKRQPGDTKLW